MKNYEVPTPIICSPFEEPKEFWYLREDQPPELRPGRRPPIVYPPSEQRDPWDVSDGALKPDEQFPGGFRMELVEQIRSKVKQWRDQGYPGGTRTTLDLLRHWRRSDREQRLFFAQIEATETIIFLHEARSDFRQGIQIPRDEPTEDRKQNGYAGFRRLACKMATGAGKTTVMGMLVAWSILNKVADRRSKTYSDVALIVCPNITIKNRLRELDPKEGEASLYRTRDLVPGHLMPHLAQGKVVITNWHVFERKTSQESRVMKVGVKESKPEKIYIGQENMTARGKRYLTEESLRRQIALGQLKPIPGKEVYDKNGNLKSIDVINEYYVESDAALVRRVLGMEIGNKENILVLNDEAHHAYRILPEADDGQMEMYDEDRADEYVKEATVWVDGLDRVHRLRRINFCLDLSATPFFLGRVGRQVNRPFPWVVSDFGLIEAIESGLTKIPQLATRDTSGAEVPYYFNIWKWVLEKLSPAERGGKKQDPKPEAVLKWAVHPITMLAQHWELTRETWANESEDKRPPVFIIVCKNTKIAKVVYEWMAEGINPKGIAPFKVAALKNENGALNTIRVDSKVVSETDSGEARDDEVRWMRLTLDTVGRQEWPRDRQGRPLYPEGFEELAGKLKRPLHPPGRDVRCIISVGMLTEGWDCQTVTHIIGLRPFMSQLLCEQVVGRGLRRASYELDEQGKFTEEVSKILGVPFEVIPYKASGTAPQPPVKRHHIYPIPQRREDFEITFPRVEGYTQAIRNKIAVDWKSISTLIINPMNIPPEVEVKAGIPDNRGRMSLLSPGKSEEVKLARDNLRLQEVVFDIAQNLVRLYDQQAQTTVPPHVLFPQIVQVVRTYLETKVRADEPGDVRDVAFSPYFGYVVERLVEAIRPDTSEGEPPEVPIYEASRGPGSTTEADFWTGKPVFEVERSHLNAVVADTKKWEQSAAYFIDKHARVQAFVKNERLGFAIPYLHDGQMHEYIPDFIIRLKEDRARYLILETKGYDPLAEVKAQAAQRWVAAVNADGKHGRWQYAVAYKPTEVAKLISEC